MLTIWVAATLLLTAEKPKADAKPKAEAKPAVLTGVWIVINAEREGQLDDTAVGDVLLIEPKNIIIHRYASEEAVTVEYLTDGATTPGRIDLYAPGGQASGPALMGVYQLNGDLLKLCLAQSGKSRPRSFNTKSEAGAAAMTLIRKKAE